MMDPRQLGARVELARRKADEHAASTALLRQLADDVEQLMMRVRSLTAENRRLTEDLGRATRRELSTPAGVPAARMKAKDEPREPTLKSLLHDLSHVLERLDDNDEQRPTEFSFAGSELDGG